VGTLALVFVTSRGKSAIEDHFGGAPKWAREARLPLAAALARVTTAPLSVLGLPGGAIVAGQTADLCVFDPNVWWRVEPAALHSQGKNTPLLGLELQGRARFTLVGGDVVFESSP
jgi:dihydroorotase